MPMPIKILGTAIGSEASTSSSQTPCRRDFNVTYATTAVSGFAWRPDGRAFAYAAQEEASDKTAIEAHEDAFEVTDAAWTERQAHLPTHPWTISAAGDTAVRLTSGRAALAGGFDYTRDGGSVVFSQSPVAGNHYRSTSMVSVDMAAKRVRAVTPPQRRASGPVASPDGMHLAYTMEHPGSPSQSDIGFSDMAGTHARDISLRLDRNAGGIAFNGDGSAVYAVANDATQSKLYRVATDGAVTALPIGSASVAGGASVANDGTLAVVATLPQSPPELYVLAPDAKSPRRLTNLNAAVAAHVITPTRTVEWRTWDGFHADGALTEPYGYVRGRRYPRVLLIHGGPTATSTTGYSGLVQLMAARGWFVFQPNYRGSDNMIAPEALGNTGDAYVELKEYDNAETYFKKAADKAKNKFLTPLYLKKLGLVYEAQNDYKSAAEVYKQIKTDYPDSIQAASIDEYIARAEAKL